MSEKDLRELDELEAINAASRQYQAQQKQSRTAADRASREKKSAARIRVLNTALLFGAAVAVVVAIGVRLEILPLAAVTALVVALCGAFRCGCIWVR